MVNIPLHRDHFPDVERDLLRSEEFSVGAFRYRHGVEALRISNSVGEMIVLPFQGQQIWDLQLYGRRQTMKSMFSEPLPGVEFLQTYGAFLLHCGFTAMGGPGPNDRHDLHGELPNASYDEASLILDHDRYGSYVGVTGSWEYARAFGPHYRATPEIRMYQRSGALRVIFRARNLNRVPLEYMYLAHANFRPVNFSTLRYTAPCDRDHVLVRDNIPAHLAVSRNLRDFLDNLRKNPELHNVLDPELPFDPEAVFFLKMGTDNTGFAHAAQVLPTGEADFITYRPSELDHAVRWICRTADQDGLGIILPATAEPDGYSAEKKKGNLKILPPGETFRCDFFVGALSAPAAQRYVEHIQATLADSGDWIDPVALDAQSH